MILVDANWDPLCDIGGYVMSLESLLVLSSVVYHLAKFHYFFEENGLMHTSPVEDNIIPTAASSRRYEEWPPGPRQLTALRVKTRLYPGFEPSRIDLLVQGSPHTCTSGRRGRAQALMSSLGVTDWFPMDNFNCSDDDPMLGMYPLRFVTEAARK